MPTHLTLTGEEVLRYQSLLEAPEKTLQGFTQNERLTLNPPSQRQYHLVLFVVQLGKVFYNPLLLCNLLNGYTLNTYASSKERMRSSVLTVELIKLLLLLGSWAMSILSNSIPAVTYHRGCFGHNTLFR